MNVSEHLHGYDQHAYPGTNVPESLHGYDQHTYTGMNVPEYPREHTLKTQPVAYLHHITVAAKEKKASF